MFEIFSFLKYLLLQGAGLAIALVVAAIFVYLILHKLHSKRIAILLFLFFFGTFLFVYVPIGIPDSITYPYGLRSYGPAEGPGLPVKNVFSFFKNIDNFEQVDDIARDPSAVPSPLDRPDDQPRTVEITLTAQEVLSEMADGVTVNYWTYDGQVPGPMLRVREGDTVELTLKNDPSSLHHHNIDLHAVTGPGGGAAVTNVAPGESKTVKFKALNPGLYVYHCAHPNVPNHMAHGMYGMILVEPRGGLPEVDKEFYVMQGEFYTAAKMGTKGLQVIDAQKMLNGNAEYVVFNGRVGGIHERMHAEVGDDVRVYFGNGGVNYISSFHVIGEIFDTVYPEAQMGGTNFKNVQTTAVPAGGATIAEFRVDVPGSYIFVDHALARLDRGAWGVLTATGTPNTDIFEGLSEDDGHEH